ASAWPPNKWASCTSMRMPKENAHTRLTRRGSCKIQKAKVSSKISGAGLHCRQGSKLTNQVRKIEPQTIHGPDVFLNGDVSMGCKALNADERFTGKLDRSGLLLIVKTLIIWMKHRLRNQ